MTDRNAIIATGTRGKTEPATVVVTGATGAVGSAAAGLLASALGPGDGLVLMGRSASRLDRLRDALLERAADSGGSPDIVTRSLNLPDSGDPVDDASLADALRDLRDERFGVAVLVNAVGPASRFTEPLALAAIGAGMHVVDPGASERLLRALDRPARKAGLAVLLGAGVQPGLTGMMLMRAVELTGAPQATSASMLVGGRQRLTPATLREYLGSLSADGGWPGAVWKGTGVTADAGRDPVSLPGVALPEGAQVSIHMDEEYAHLAGSRGLGELRAANVMDAPRTIDMMRRWIAGEATEQDVSDASARDADAAADGTDLWFGIDVHARCHDDAGMRVARATLRCDDSYVLSGEVAGMAALAVLGRGAAAAVVPGARWASDSPAADVWARLEALEFSFEADPEVPAPQAAPASSPPQADSDAPAPESDPGAPSPEADARAGAATPCDGMLVVGAGFGRHYATALARSTDAPLAAIAGRGGRAGRELAARLDVRYARITAPADVVGDVGVRPSGAVVAVRSELVGGDGDAIVEALLEASIPVMQELPVAPATMSRHLSLAHRRKTRYMVCGLYEFTAPVRRFVDCVDHLRERTKITHVVVRTSHQVLERAGLILAEALGAVPTGRHVVSATASPEWMLISGRWGRIPVDIMVANRMAPQDPDNHSQPMMTAVVETGEGELSWNGPVSAPRWQQRPHTRDGRLTDPLGDVAREWGSSDRVPEAETWGAVVDAVWPEAVRSAAAMLTGDDARARDMLEHNRRCLCVLRWWQDVSAQLPAPERIDSRDSAHIDPPEVKS